MMDNADSKSPHWLLFARTALAVAILMGVLLGLAGGDDAGGHRLRVASRIVHSNFAYLFWPMALLAGLWSQHLSGLGRRLSGLGLVLAAGGALVAVFVPWAGNGPPLASVLPLVRHPLHGAAIGLFLAGICLTLFALLASHWRRGERPMDALLWYPVLPFTLALVAAGWVWLAAGEVSEEVRLSNTLWVAVAELSFLQAPLLLRGWFWLLERDGRRDLPSTRWRHALLLTAVLPAVLVLPLLALVDPGDPDFLLNFDLLASWGGWPAVAASGLVLGVCLVRSWSSGSSPAARYTFVASVLLFVLGALAGVVGDETGTLYQAQLHWTGGALAMVYIVLLGGTETRGVSAPGSQSLQDAPRLEPLLWCVGLLAVGGGIGLLGLLVVAGALADAGGRASLVPLGRWFLLSGALLVLLGGALSARRLAHANRLGGSSDGWSVGVRDRLTRMDLRVRAVLATALAIGMIGGIIALLPPQIGLKTPEGGTGLPGDNHDHVVSQLRGEVKERFDQGVVMLHARRYDEAATAFHRVLALAPEMPEAHVNMGFAMLGKEDYKLALDFFEGATELRVNQLNAYYGMALAYEGLGNIEAAAGAMKSYQHLTAPDDPFLPKVYAKLQQYEQQRGARSPRGGT